MAPAISSVSVRAVSKRYGAVEALRAVDVDVRAGGVHALVGANGAGKSTVIRVLAGLERPDAGSVLVDGDPVALGGRAAAIRHRIGLVPQQLSLVGEMDLVDNLALTQPALVVHRRHAESLLLDAASQAGIDIQIGTPVAALGLAERQLGELAIALAQGARILLLDEPTSALGPYESGGLFDRIRALADAGVGIALITHRIDEVRQVADEVTVLSHGSVVLHGMVADLSDDELVQAMVGSVTRPAPPVAFSGGRDRLVLRKVRAGRPGRGALHDVDLTVREGEIVGVLGVAGNGQATLADTAAGVAEPHAGTVHVDGTDISGHPDAAATAGVSYVPEVRADFLVPDAPMTQSAVLRRLRDTRFSSQGALRWGRITEFTRALVSRHDVRPGDPQLRTATLSGGNQQKLLVGRELDGAPAVAVLHGPTQGLDLHASAAVRGEIRRAAHAGTGVLLVSADIDEVRELASRILVLSHGRIVDELDAAHFDLQRVGRAMAGLTEQDAA